MSVELCCDFCGRPLPKIVVEIQGGGFGGSAHTNIYFTKGLIVFFSDSLNKHFLL